MHCILAILSLLSQSVVLIITLGPAIGISYRYHILNLIKHQVFPPLALLLRIYMQRSSRGYRKAESIDSFKKQLKTYFFSISIFLLIISLILLELVFNLNPTSDLILLLDCTIVLLDCTIPLVYLFRLVTKHCKAHTIISSCGVRYKN